jgi:hypothetical protein
MPHEYRNRFWVLLLLVDERRIHGPIHPGDGPGGQPGIQDHPFADERKSIP